MDESGTVRWRWWRDGWPQAVTLGAAFLATFWARLPGARLVFAQGELLQWDGDSAYHLKRILYALQHFPGLLRFDPAMNWPAGAPCPWPDGFDLLAAGWGLLLGFGDPARATVAIMLFTPMLALLAMWAAMDLARLVVPEGPAKGAAVFAAGVLTGLAPSSLFQSQVGFLDHHICELLAAMLLFGWALRRLPGPGAPFSRSPAAWEIGGALATVFALWVFAGGVLYVALACAVVVAALILDERPRIVGSGAPALAAGAAISALLTWPAIRAHGRMISYQFPSLLPPLLVALAAGGVAVSVLVTRLTKRRAARIGLLGLLGPALLAGAALSLSQAANETRAGLVGWLLRRDPWIATIAEFQPLSADRRGLLMALWTNFGAAGFAAPVLLAAGGWNIVRTARARGVAFLALSVGFALFTLNQNRFGRIGVPLLMIDVAAVLAALAHRRRARQSLSAARVFPAVAALVLIACDPILRPSLVPPYIFQPPVVAAALDLRDHARGDAPTGVLTPWDLGHTMSVLSGLPTLTNGFGPYLDAGVFDEADRVFREDPDALDVLLARHRSRFVVAGAMESPLLAAVNGRSPFVLARGAKGAILDLEYMKAFALSPLIIGGSAIPGSDVHHLEHLLPLFASKEQPPRLAFGLPSLWVYERVPGARLVGTAPPGARVLASLEFREQGRPHQWRAFTDAGDDGRFELVIPFPTAYARPTLSSAAAYAIRLEEGPVVEVQVPERAVRAGEVIRVGAVRPSVAAVHEPRRPRSG